MAKKMKNVKSTRGSGKKGYVNVSTPRNWGRRNMVEGGATAAAEGASRKSGK